MTEDDKKPEIDRMQETWIKIKDDLYAKGLDRLDDTAKSMITLSSALITLGFTVTSAIVGAKILQGSYVPLWFSFSGFFFLMLSTISAVLVVYRRPSEIVQDSLPPAISTAWKNSLDYKYRCMKAAYFCFLVGVILEIVAIFSLLV